LYTVEFDGDRRYQTTFSNAQSNTAGEYQLYPLRNGKQLMWANEGNMIP